MDLGLLRRLITSKRLQHLVMSEGFLRSGKQRLQCFGNSSLPIDQCAVAVEGQYFEVIADTGSSPWRIALPELSEKQSFLVAGAYCIEDGHVNKNDAQFRDLG